MATLQGNRSKSRRNPTPHGNPTAEWLLLYPPSRPSDSQWTATTKSNGETTTSLWNTSDAEATAASYTA